MPSPSPSSQRYEKVKKNPEIVGILKKQRLSSFRKETSATKGPHNPWFETLTKHQGRDNSTYKNPLPSKIKPEEQRAIRYAVPLLNAEDFMPAPGILLETKCCRKLELPG